MRTPLYDTGALIAAESNNRIVWNAHRQCLEREREPIVPASAMAQAVRSGAQANLNRLLRSCRIASLDRSGAREIGRLLAASQTADIVDADVVRVALATDGAILTSDRADLVHLAASVGADLPIIDV